MLNPKINILFFLPNFDTGGSEKLVLDIINGLDKNRFNPVLVVFFSGIYEELFGKLNIPFYVIHREKLRSKLKTLVFLRGLARKHNVNIVNTHHISPLLQGVVPLRILRRTMLVHTEHSRLDLDQNLSDKAIRRERFCLKKVDIALGVSQAVCDYFRNELGVPEGKIVKILNGVDAGRFKLDFNQKAYRSQLGLQRNSFLIGMFGNFRTEKNHWNLIRAAAILRDRGVPPFQVILCGSGPTEKDAQQLVGQLDLGQQVRFLGVRLDIPHLMNLVDVYCLPSRFEGLPLSILEAMACGKPVVATNVFGNNEAVEHRKTGILVEPESPVALADGLLEVMKDDTLRQTLGRNGYLRHSALFSFETMMQQYYELFDRLYRRLVPETSSNT